MKLKLNNENNDHILTPFYISTRLDYGKVFASEKMSYDVSEET